MNLDDVELVRRIVRTRKLVQGRLAGGVGTGAQVPIALTEAEALTLDTLLGDLDRRLRRGELAGE